MRVMAVASLLAISAGLGHGHPPSTRALVGNVVIRKFGADSNTFVDTTVAVEVNGGKTLQPLKPLSHPRAIQMISTTSDASYVTCDYTCGHRGAMDGKTVICGSTTMEFGSASHILDDSWVDSVDKAACFDLATDISV